ncbi:MAG: T9SS type A sorting domain-containing protein [Candidatus Cloacimonetes bacterium]|nr:T9SS type A sorting domain-containing protein [Candidatus Cloacimonadota bacterium]MBL7086093.1 T9SS type A sorting domain-containing protein [Candidatus Cloacimonadota bacterium]
MLSNAKSLPDRWQAGQYLSGKKIYVTIFILFLFSQLAGDPVPPPSVISEIYFEGNNWTIELAYAVEWTEPLFLDECTLISSAGETTFNEGTVLFPDSILLITEDDISTPLFIDKNGDFIMITGSFVDDIISFGTYPGSYVNAPNEGQSLARGTLEYYWYDWQGFPTWIIIYILAKDNIPSLGSNIFSVNTRGTFCGYVYDLQGNPIQGAIINYFSCPNEEEFIIETSENGYFENTNMYGMNYDVTIYVDDIAMLDTLITIEPDSTTYCEFYINLTSVDEEIKKWNQINLSNYPNPFIESTRISFSATDLHGFTQINIYNIRGQLVKALMPMTNDQCPMTKVVWDGTNQEGVLQPPGFYFYSFEVDGKKIKTNKMIMVR